MFKSFFPYFQNSDITYLDNGATTQKPQCVMDEIVKFYTQYNSNTHRSSHGSANKATMAFENARTYIQKFIHAPNEQSIIFTKGVTESINFVAQSFADSFETVIISSLEHHANIVPWHMQGRTIGKGLEVVKYKEDLSFDYEHFEYLLEQNPNAFVSITHVSNAFGTVYDIARICQLAHMYKAVVMVDGAQSLTHFQVDVQALDVDFYTLSGHKTYGPTGVGVLYIKEEHLNKVKPYQTGGATIDDVSFERSTFLDAPYKFEAGTQNIAGVIGFHAALEFIQHIGYDTIASYEKELYDYLHQQLLEVDYIELYNTPMNAVGSKSFNIKGTNHDDIGILLDKQKIAVRVGHHCAQPIMKALNIKGTIRVSLALYNTKEDIDAFIKALKRAISMLKD